MDPLGRAVIATCVETARDAQVSTVAMIVTTIAGVCDLAALPLRLSMPTLSPTSAISDLKTTLTAVCLGVSFRH